MYINDWPNCSTFTTVLYADDTYLCLSDKNVNDLQFWVNSKLLKVDRWMRLNKLSINNCKSAYMLISKSLRNTYNENIPLSFQIRLNKLCVLESKNMYQITIRVLIDSKLDWSSHAQFGENKFIVCISFIVQTKKLIPISVLKMLYYSFVYCHLQYCIMSRGTANNSVLQPLNVLHDNVSRIMTFSNYSCHATTLCKNLNVLKLNGIYRLEVAKFMRKLHHGALPKIYHNFFQTYF